MLTHLLLTCFGRQKLCLLITGQIKKKSVLNAPHAAVFVLNYEASHAAKTMISFESISCFYFERRLK